MLANILRRRLSTLVVLGVAALVAVGAYGVYTGAAVGDLDDGGPKDEDAFKIPESAEEAARSTVNRNDRLREIGERAPAFGGMYREPGREVLVVLLTDTGRKADAEAAIRAIFGDDWIPPNGVEARDAQYEMRQLMSWWDMIMSVKLPEGITSLGIAQEKNRLSIGIDEQSSVPAVQNWLHDLGIPAGAYETPVMGKLQTQSHETLQDRVRPLWAGLTMETDYAFGSDPCTLGFITLRDVEKGYIEPAHCTTEQGQVDNDDAYQDVIGSNNLIGLEAIDPDFASSTANNHPDCPVFRECRWSDSVFFSHNIFSDPPTDRGFIARPQQQNNALSPLTHSPFRIIDEAVFGPDVNDYVHKVGRSTGWTNGPVEDDCRVILTTTHQGDSVAYVCQYLADYSSSGGDSGSPVFDITDSPQGGDSVLAGMHIGRYAGYGAFSHVSDIYRDLDTSAAWYSCAPSLSC